MDAMTKTYDPPLTADPHGPLYRVDQAIKVAQERLDAAIDAKRLHTNQNLAQEVIKEAREALKKSEKLRVHKLTELGASKIAVKGRVGLKGADCTDRACS
jgi:hypothetical protein